MEMEDQYALSDLRQFISRASVSQFPPYAQQQQQQQQSLSDFMTANHHHRGLIPTSTAAAAAAAHQHQQSPYEMVVMGRHVGAAGAAGAGVNTVDMLHNRVGSSSANHHHIHQYQDHFNCDSTTTTATAGNNSSGFDCPDGGAARWPRQETLTLLEIRSRLDHKFKEANQKGPLWDEVARIMSEEHRYQRSGKKCREKFENLYKYYKKTKEGKAGRQDGKHYRFFRQLEALYGEHHQNNSTSTLPTPTSDAHIIENAPHFSIPAQQNSSLLGQPPPRGDNTSASLSNSSDFEVSSSEEDELNGSMESNGSMDRKKKRKGKRSWKAKIKEFIDLQMRKIMEKQEAWLEKMMKTLESREHERMVREDEWRKSEAERVEREHKFWANERSWIEARDAALMTALDKLSSSSNNINNRNNGCGDQWPEPEVTRLIQLRTSMDSRFQQCGFSEEVLWEDIAAKMAYFGYERSAIVCKEKWDCINKYFQEKGIKDDCKKKRKENYGAGIHNNHSNNNHNVHHNHDLNDQAVAGGGLYMNYQLGGFSNGEINEPRLQLNEGSSSPSSHNSNVNANANTSAAVNPAGNVMNDSCLRFFLGDGESLGWESNYGLKLNKGDHNQCA